MGVFPHGLAILLDFTVLFLLFMDLFDLLIICLYMVAFTYLADKSQKNP